MTGSCMHEFLIYICRNSFLSLEEVFVDTCNLSPFSFCGLLSQFEYVFKRDKKRAHHENFHYVSLEMTIMINND